MQKAISPSEQVGGTEISTSLQALAALASRLGVDVSVDQLRRRFALPPGEPDTPTLIAVARELGLDAQTLRMSFQELPRLARALPAILRAKDGGALILEEARSDPTKGTVAVIRDPSDTDNVVLAIDELHLAEVWEGEAILIKRRHSITDEQRPFGMAWLFGQLVRERKLFKDIIAAAVVSTVFAIAPPFIFMIVLDRVLVNTSYSTLNVIAGGLVILIAFEMALGYFRRVLTQVVTTRIDGRLGLYIMEKLVKLPMDYFERTPAGRILTNLAQVWQIRWFLTGQLFGAFLDAVPLIGLVPVMLIIEWHLALMAFALGGIIFVIVMVFLPPLKRCYHKVVVAEQAKGSHLTETVHGIRTIKSLALEGRRRREWDHRVADAASARNALGLMANYPETLSLPFQRLIYSGCMVVGAYMVLNQQSSTGPFNPGAITSSAIASGALSAVNATPITAGALVAFAMLSLRLAQPLVKIAELQRDLAEVRGSIYQVAQVVNVVPEDTRTNGLRLPIKGEVSFKDVRFRYSPDAPYALDEVSFTVPAGSMLGIMGRSGSGKTTVTRLLQCLNSTYEGMIKIDGMDLREIDLMHLRTHIGVVPQENFLFSGTIRENISMAKPDASFTDVVRAAQLSGAEEFIERLPRGYDTDIQEGGTNLSGGQRQRIALARALLIDPPVLILDEATSALDAESEAIVNANLKRMAKGRTMLSISHRLSMLVESDAILVLEQGKVYDIGTHEELLRRCDIYKHMWHQQNRHLDPRAADTPLSMSRGVA
jgi:ATP-binding cassette subfamily B protein